VSYGVRIDGQTTIEGDWNGDALRPWSEIEAASVMIQLRKEFMALGAAPPEMRVVSLAKSKVRKQPAGKAERRGAAQNPPAKILKSPDTWLKRFCRFMQVGGQTVENGHNLHEQVSVSFAMSQFDRHFVQD
jgi:hypothetical protein